MKANDIMTSEVITVKENDTVEFVTNLLLINRISGVPVINDDDEVVGVVTETDLIFKDKDLNVPPYISLLGGFILLESLNKFEKQLNKMAAYKVKHVMSTPVFTVKENEDVREIVNMMLEKGINRVPVINEENKLAGIIARSDILRNI